ncbi:MAG: hydantoinase/oxoprolinase family protein [Alphaproteobacteria bacterium]|nr:hydantoinase/oxoprolinase family protein [Alphaproteobacteria bacterium]
MRVGVEVGGTFTDLVAIDADGAITIAKVPSVPGNPDEGAFNAIVESTVPVSGIDDLVHGSTIATNAVLERKGARIAFITTSGFRDILIMQRHNRSRVYDLTYRKPQPVVRRRDSFEVTERILADGSVLVPLDAGAVQRDLVPRLREGGYEAVAICLLNGYANPAHEEELQSIIARNCQNIEIACSSTVTREFREYERASPTTLSAYVQPVINRYLERFEKRLAQDGFAGRFSVMQSNGGRLPAEGMRRNAITSLLSGPAAGVTGAIRQAGRSGYRDLVTLDMGGTSTDVCLVTAGEPELTAEFSLDGLPVRTPIIDINTIGAGGGSIIWIDDGGMLRAGPVSAGADPGPACYGRGGTRPTVTDAHVVRGTLKPESFLGGRMAIDAQASREVFQPLADSLAMGLEDISDAAIRVANASIVRAMQIVSTERGKDPRDHALVAFGGAGPLHAAHVAGDLGMTSVIVPPHAGVLSAYGLIASDYQQFSTVTRKMLLDDAAPGAIAEVYRDMRKRAIERFVLMGLGSRPRISFFADMRFVGQAFEVAVPVDPPSGLTTSGLRTLFADEHHRVFMHGGDASRPIEIVAFRLGVSAPLKVVPALKEEPGDEEIPFTPWRYHDRGRWRDGVIGHRTAMAPGTTLAGPALIEDDTATIAVPDGWSATRDQHHNLVLTRAG